MAATGNRVTFAHCLNVSGYETVLCGRMHFVGPDQRHGFSKRIAGEQTPIYHNRPASLAVAVQGFTIYNILDIFRHITFLDDVFKKSDMANIF